MKIKNKNVRYVGILFLALFLLVTFFVATNTFIINFDSFIDSAIRNNSTLDNLAKFITDIASTTIIVILFLLLLSILIYRKKIYEGFFAVASIVGSFILGYLVKLLVARARPESSIIEETGYSFPSGHALKALIFFSLLIYLFKNDIKSVVLRNIFVSVNVLLIILIGFSRVYLHVHWASDIIGSWLLGLFWLYLMIFLFKDKIKTIRSTRR